MTLCRSSHPSPHPVVFSSHPVVFSPHPVVFSQGFLTRDELRALRSTCREYFTDLKPIQSIEARRILGGNIKAPFLILEKVATFAQIVHLSQDPVLTQFLCDICTAAPSISYKALAAATNSRLGFAIPYYDPIALLVYKNTASQARPFFTRELNRMTILLPEDMSPYTYRSTVLALFSNALHLIKEEYSAFYKFVWILAILEHLLKTQRGRFFFLEEPRFTRVMLDKIAEFGTAIDNDDTDLINRVYESYRDLTTIYQLFQD